MKAKRSDETKEAKQKKQKENKKKIFWSEMKGKQPLIILSFEAKQKIR
jgi:hypothetical protein